MKLVVVHGNPVGLRQLTTRELAKAIEAHQRQFSLVSDELESLIGERIRRESTRPADNVIALF